MRRFWLMTLGVMLGAVVARGWNAAQSAPAPPPRPIPPIPMPVPPLPVPALPSEPIQLPHKTYCVKEAGELLHLNPRTVRSAITTGDLPAYRENNTWRIRREDLQQPVERSLYNQALAQNPNLMTVAQVSKQLGVHRALIFLAAQQLSIAVTYARAPMYRDGRATVAYLPFDQFPRIAQLIRSSKNTHEAPQPLAS